MAGDDMVYIRVLNEVYCREAEVGTRQDARLGVLAVDKPGKVVAVKQGAPHPKRRQGKHNTLMVLLLQGRMTSVQPPRMTSKSLPLKLGPQGGPSGR